MGRDDRDPVKIRRLWIAGEDGKTRSISIPVDLHYWWQRRYRGSGRPEPMKYLRLVGNNGVIECYPLREYKKPSGELNEFVVSVSLNGPKKEYGRFAFPRRLLYYLYKEHPNLQEVRIIMKDGWFVCEPI